MRTKRNVELPSTPTPLTAEDVDNLKKIVARGQYNGIGESAAAVALFNKLQLLLQTLTPATAPAPKAKEEKVDSGDQSEDSAK